MTTKAKRPAQRSLKDAFEAEYAKRQAERRVRDEAERKQQEEDLARATELHDLLAPAVARVIAHAALDGPIGPLIGRLRALPPFDLAFDSRTKISTVAITRAALRHRGFYCCLPGYFLCDDRPQAGRSRPRPGTS